TPLYGPRRGSEAASRPRRTGDDSGAQARSLDTSPPSDGGGPCSNASPIAPAASSSWHRTRPGCSTTTTSAPSTSCWVRSEEHTSELQSRFDLVCRLLLE